MRTHDTFESAAEVLETFRPVMRAIAAAGGPSCEVVLHNLEGSDVDLGHTIAAIENGHVTGREVGGPSTSLGLIVVHNRQEDHDAFGYRGFTGDGRELRCSSIYFRNREGDVIAALCINIDLSAVRQARSILDALLPQESASLVQPDEYIGRDLVSMMDTMIDEAIREVGKPTREMSRDDKIGVLQKLDARGATQMRKSVETIGMRLGISRVTAYSYLDEARRSVG
jgi:predicted transcriptional regulator YheO